jgi:hypothetical protein
VIAIAEAAVTYLVARSNTEIGRRLNRFIHTEVLPAIREKGFYQLKPQNSLEVTDLLNKLMLFMETSQANQLAMKEEQREIKEDLQALKKSVGLLFQHIYDFRLDIIRRNHEDSRLVQEKVQAASQKTTENLLTLGKSVKKLSKETPKASLMPWMMCLVSVMPPVSNCK